MTKDEMKNKISMELKNSITQQGFEIICKNLAELEKEISNLLSCKDCPDNHGGYICDKEYNDRCLSQKIQYIKELKEEITTLEKENAELKEQNRNLLESCAGATMMYKQLIKAKE